MVKCPNINSPQWRELVEKTDLQTAYRVFMQNEDSVPYLGTRDNNYLLDQVVTGFNIKKPLKGKDGRLLKLEDRLFNRQVAEELVSDIRSSYTGDYTIDIVSIDENNNSIKIEGYPIPTDKDINEVLYTVLDEDLNVSTKYEQRADIKYYNLEKGKQLYEQYNLLNNNGEIKTVPYNTVEEKRKTNEWVATLNKSPYYYFEVRKTTVGYKILIADRQRSIDYEQRIDYGLKVINALGRIQRNKFEQSKLQGWVNDLAKQGVTKEQIEIFKASAKDGMNKEEIASSIMANYSFVVEVDVAISRTGRPRIGFDQEQEKYTITDDSGVVHYFVNKPDAVKFQKELERKLDRPTSYYSNLSAPGNTGINKYEGNPDWEYQELEFKTPLITPSIKGHAQFATDNGIGWARVWYNKKTGVVEIQEIQSDLFQKGRNKEVISGQYNTIQDKEKGIWYKESENQFLQLLNKDSNWVTFFIKSIIQDSAKKGYEKVLFPKGETAAKIEGHETIAEELTKINRKQEAFNTGLKIVEQVDYIFGKKIITYKAVDKLGTEFNSSRTKADIEAYVDKYKENQQREYDALEKRKQELKSQGIEKLKPIEAFYEIKVGNILEKQFGKDNVKTITDEYGNEWREITIDLARDLSAIELQKPSTPFMDRAEREAKQQKQSERRREINKQKERLLKVFPQIKEVIEDYNMPQLGTVEAGGTIIRINPDLMRDDTLLHEFGHLLIDLLGGIDNDLVWEARKALAGSEIEKSVLRRYPELVGTTAFAKEVVAQALGEDAAKVWAEEEKRSVWENVLNKILNYLKELLGINKSEIRKLTRMMLKDKPFDASKYDSKASQYVQEQRDNINYADGQTIVNAIKELSSAVEFDEATHTYTLEGEELTPVSTLMSEAGFGIKKEDENPTIQRGQKIGTVIHKNAEAIANNVKDIVTVDSGFELMQKAHTDLKGILAEVFGEKYTLLNEAIIVDAEAGVAGTADVVAVDNNNNVFIFDFKTKEQSKKGFAYYDSSTFGRTQREKNTLQLSMYKHMLKRSIGLEVKDLYVVPLVADVNKYNKITSISLDKSLSIDGLVQLKYNPLAEELLAKNEAKKAQKQLITSEDYSLNEDSIEFKSAQISNNILDKHQRVYQDAVDTLTARLAVARAKNKPGDIMQLEILLKEMEEAALDPKRGIALYVNEVTSRINNMWNTYLEREEKERSGQKSVWSAGQLVHWNEALSAFDNIEEVVEILLTEDSGLDKKTLELDRRLLEDAISKKNKLKNLYRDKGVSLLAEHYYPLIKRVIKEEERAKRVEWTNNNRDKISSMSVKDINVARNEYAKKYITDNYPELLQLTKLRFEQELIKAHEDIGYLTRWLETILNTNDMVTAAMAKEFVIQYDKGRTESIRVRNEMIDKLRALENHMNYKASMPVEKLYDWMLEKDENGKLTGHILTKINSKLVDMMNRMMEETRSLPKAQRNKKRAEWRKQYGLNTDWVSFNKDYVKKAEELNKQGILSDAGLKAFKDNEIVPYHYRPNLTDIVEISHEAADELIKWKQDNRLKYMYLEEGSKYENKGWKELEKILSNPNDPRTQWYNFIIDMSSKADSYLPANSKLNLTLPAITKGFTESVQSGRKVKELIKESYERNLLRHPNDIDRGKLDESTNAPVFFLPTFYTRGESYDVAQQSYDLATLYFNFYRMAADYNYKNEIIGNLELTKKFINERKYTLRDRKGNPIKKILDERREKELTKSGQVSLLAAQVEDFFKMQIYGQKTSDLGHFEVLGLKIDTVKAIEMLNKYAALNMLGLNFVQGFANVTLGELQNITEIVGAEYIRPEDMVAASKVYFSPKNHAEMLGDIGSRKPASLVNILNEKWDILNEYEGGVYRKSSKFAQLMSTNTLFFTSHMGEHFMQSRIMLAMLNKIEAKDKDGNVLGSMLDMYTVEKGELKLNDKVDLEMSNWTEEQQALFGAKTKRILARLHGEYSELGKIAIQRHVAGRTALMFRKFMVPGFEKRYGKLRFNEFLEEWTEGSYRQIGRFVNNVFKDLVTLKLSLVTEHYKSLLPGEQANIRRALMEMGFMLMTFILSYVFVGMAAEADDDREKWVYDFLTYQTRRTRAELSFFWNPAEALNILVSPAASVSIVEDFIKLIGQMTFGPFDVYQTGSWKGRYKMTKRMMRLTPGIKQWYRLRDIEDYTNLFQFN